MSFFTQDFVDFFLELENNNNREWFQENKKRYEKSVKEPFEHFVQDMIYRIKEDDESVPYKYNGYWYYKRFETGKDYPIHCRKKSSLEADEIILFDNNLMAKKLKMSPLTYWKFESGRQQITMDLSNKISEVFKIPFGLSTGMEPVL